MGLTINLQQACVKVLLQCWELKDKHTLEPVFGDAIFSRLEWPHMAASVSNEAAPGS